MIPMVTAWAATVVLGLGASLATPRVELGPDGEVALVHLRQWLIHDGDARELRQADGTRFTAGRVDSIDEAAVLRLFAAPGPPPGWRAATLPVALDVGSRDVSSPGDWSWWLVSQFLVDDTMDGHSVAVWVPENRVRLAVYLNGQLIGSHGRGGDSYFGGSLMPTAYVVPAAFLRRDGPNTIALHFTNPVTNTALDRVWVGDPQLLEDALFTHVDVPRFLSGGGFAVLVAMMLYYLVLFLHRRDEVEYLYLALGTLSYACIFLLTWARWFPFDSIYLLALGFVSIIGSCFYVPFFQHFYKIHRHRAWPYALLATMVLGLAVMALMGNRYHAFLITLAGLPCMVAGFVYAFYLNLRARRAGHESASIILVGFVLLASALLVDTASVVTTRLVPHGVGVLGIMGFMGSVLLSLTLRFLRLHDKSEQIAARLRQQHAQQEYLIERIAQTAYQIELTAEHILASAGQQERGATEQSTAVEETRRTMESLLSSGRNITAAAEDVLRNAELTQRHNQLVADRISESSNHSRRITEILDVIRDVANKSELLALNAALEGSRAGEAGRGFALVATQMQRLAENVMSAVADIKELTADIRAASSATETSTAEAARIASATTSSAKQISFIIQDQQSGTEQVVRVMDDVALIAQQTASSGQVTLERTRALMELADRLHGLVDEMCGEGSAGPSSSWSGPPPAA